MNEWKNECNAKSDDSFGKKAKNIDVVIIPRGPINQNQERHQNNEKAKMKLAVSSRWYEAYGNFFVFCFSVVIFSAVFFFHSSPLVSHFGRTILSHSPIAQPKQTKGNHKVCWFPQYQILICNLNRKQSDIVCVCFIVCSLQLTDVAGLVGTGLNFYRRDSKQIDLLHYGRAIIWFMTLQRYTLNPYVYTISPAERTE